MLDGVLDGVVSNVVQYCSREKTRERLESEVLTPVVRYVAHKFSWSVRLFQAVAVLVFIQTMVLLWLLLRDCRRPPLPAPAAVAGLGA